MLTGCAASASAAAVRISVAAADMTASAHPSIMQMRSRFDGRLICMASPRRWRRRSRRNSTVSTTGRHSGCPLRLQETEVCAHPGPSRHADCLVAMYSSVQYRQHASGSTGLTCSMTCSQRIEHHGAARFVHTMHTHGDVFGQLSSVP